LTLKVKAPWSLLILITIYQTTECNISEDLNLHQHNCQNLKFCNRTLLTCNSAYRRQLSLCRCTAWKNDGHVTCLLEINENINYILTSNHANIFRTSVTYQNTREEGSRLFLIDTFELTNNMPLNSHTRINHHLQRFNKFFFLSFMNPEWILNYDIKAIFLLLATLSLDPD
jgi:hypothetical protein